MLCPLMVLEALAWCASGQALGVGGTFPTRSKVVWVTRPVCYVGTLVWFEHLSRGHFQDCQGGRPACWLLNRVTGLCV